MHWLCVLPRMADGGMSNNACLVMRDLMSRVCFLVLHPSMLSVRICSWRTGGPDCQIV